MLSKLFGNKQPIDKPRQNIDKPIPSLQLIAKITSFDGTKVNGRDIGDGIEYDRVTPDFRPVSKTHALQSSAMSSLLTREEDPELESDYYKPPPEEYKSSTSSIIGGVRSYDPWKTTNTLMNNPQAKTVARKIQTQPSYSPYTGEREEVYQAKQPENEVVQLNNNILDSAEDHPLMEKLRASVIARGGGVGILNLGRKFRIMDDDNSKSLSLAEFRKGMRETVPGITDSDITLLFRVFDRHGDGSIDYDEFVVTLAVRAATCLPYNIAHAISSSFYSIV